MPAPMTAPTPKAVSWKGPRVRFRLRSPVSPASARSMFIGFRAQIFAMRCFSPSLFKLAYLAVHPERSEFAR